jgi:hypothetical protein
VQLRAKRDPECDGLLHSEVTIKYYPRVFPAVHQYLENRHHTSKECFDLVRLSKAIENSGYGDSGVAGAKRDLAALDTTKLITSKALMKRETRPSSFSNLD